MKVLVLEASGLHLGYLGCYGNDWVATPNLDRLAAEGVVFDRHYLDNPGGSERSAWTGRYAFPTSPESTAHRQPGPSLEECLKSSGVVFSHARLGPEDLIDGSLASALAELDGRTSGGWLVWASLPSLAPPWELPDDYLEMYFDDEDKEDGLTPLTDPPVGPVEGNEEDDWHRLQNTYAGAVTYLDDQVGVFLEDLEERCLLQKIVLCFTAGSGLALGEHGFVGECGPGAFEERSHVPLILRRPGREDAGRRVAALTQPVDLFPTLAELFAVTTPHNHGHSVLPLAQGTAESVREYACFGGAQGKSAAWSVRTPEWAYLSAGGATTDDPLRPRLYVKPDDRWEVNDVLQHHLDLGDHFEKTLKEFIEATLRADPFQPPHLGDLNQLEAFGSTPFEGERNNP